MSTKAATAHRPITEQARPVLSESLRAAAEGFLSATSRARNWSCTYAALPLSAIHRSSEKAIEAQRQIERVQSLNALCSFGPQTTEDEERVESIASSVALLSSFITSPIPIPVASSGTDLGTTLFFGDDDFYGDLEIKGKSVEYFLKIKRNGAENEVFDTEEIKNGFVPPRLLSCLFAHYAR